MREDISNAFVRLLDATERECLVLRYGLHDGVTNSIEETAEIMDFCDPDDVSLVLSSRTAVESHKYDNTCTPPRFVSLCPRMVTGRDKQHVELKKVSGEVYLKGAWVLIYGSMGQMMTPW